MNRRFVVTLIRLLLTTLLLFVTVSEGSAQTKKTTPQNGKAPQAMKMRSMTNAQRKAVAVRNADRKAAYARAHQKGVK